MFSHALNSNSHTHTHTFNCPISGTIRVGRYQKCINNLDFTEARDSEWQWHQLGHMQVCISLQTDNHASTQFFTGRMPFLSPNQQRQRTEGMNWTLIHVVNLMLEWKLKPPVSMAIRSGQNIIKAEKLTLLITLLISRKTSKQSSGFY